MPHPILLYDGVCGLCNRLVQFVLRRDGDGVFRFASLQSEFARRILARHGADAGDLDTVCVVVDAELPEERMLARCDAVIFILRQMGAAELRSAHPGLKSGSTQSTPTRGLSFWGIVGAVLQLVPRNLRDWGYRVVARHRYRVFGRYDACPIPSAETRWRFLDLGQGCILRLDDCALIHDGPGQLFHVDEVFRDNRLLYKPTGFVYKV